MARHSTARTESAALLRELEALRAKPLSTPDAADKTEPPPGPPPDTTDVSTDTNWDEVRHVLQELGDELEQMTHKRPLVGMAGAFVLGVLIGRAVTR